MQVLNKIELRTSKDVLYQKLGEQTILLDLKTDKLYELNATAARLWELVSAGTTVNDIGDQLLVEFEVEPGALTRDLASMVSMMVGNGLIIEVAKP